MPAVREGAEPRVPGARVQRAEKRQAPPIGSHRVETKMFFLIILGASPQINMLNITRIF
jgi:hypothetical protein